MFKHIFKYLLFILTFCLINSYAKISFDPVAGSKTGMKEVAPDTLKILAVRVEFEDDDLDFTTGTGKFDSGYPDTLMIDGTPHDKAYFEDQLEFTKNYFEAVSGGKVQISTYTVLDRIDTLTHPIWYYNQNNGSEVLLEKLLEMYSDTWNAVKDDVSINFSDYNTFVIFHAGSGQEFNPGYDETPFDIPSVYLSSADLESVKVTAHDGTVINNAVILPECEWQIYEDNWYHAGMGGISCLMFAHRLGIPNLYSSDDGRSCIGKFGLMDQGSANFYGMMPAGVSAWVKELKGWADVRTIETPEDDITVTSDSTIYRIDLNNDEYLLIENRTPVNYTSALNEIYGYDRDGRQIRFFYDEEGLEDYEVDAGFKTLVKIDNDDYDFGLPTGYDIDNGDIMTRSKGGLLVWHIDKSKTTDYNIENNHVNDDYSNRGVYLEEADGSFDIGKDYWLLDNGYGTELGWFYDSFSSDNEYWKEYPNKGLNSVEFSSVSYPRADTNDGIQAGIKLSGFSIIGREMLFSFSYEDEENYFSIDTELGAAVYLPAYPGGKLRHFFAAGDGTFKIFEGDSLALSGILAGPVSTDQLPVFNLNSAILCGADSLSIVTYDFNDGSSSAVPVSGRINGQIKGTVIPTDNGLEIRDSGFSLLDVFGSVTDVSELSVLTDGSGEPLFVCGISGSEFFYSDLSEA
ncbi:MAG TPA: hypothetical protein PKW56_09825, partial [Clostridiales bacterium]|nr:hypothetical protein [Clostridiales bacterium]